MDPEVHRAMMGSGKASDSEREAAIEKGMEATKGFREEILAAARTDQQIHIHVHLAVEPETRQFRAEILGAIRNLRREMRMNKDEVLAEVRANTDIVKSIQAGENVLLNGHATIEDELNDLMAQIAAGNTAPDFSDIQAALAEQKTAIQGIGAAMRVNTPAEQPTDANQPDSGGTPAQG